MSVTALRNDREQMSHQAVRAILVVGAIGMFALSALFVLIARDHRLAHLATLLWPWGDSPLSYYFLASMQAAIGAAMLWIGLSGELAALAPGALNLVVMMAGCALSFFVIGFRENDTTLYRYALGCLLFALFNSWLYVWARRLPFQNSQPLPRLLWVSYILFAIVLAGVGLALILGMEGVLPWTFNLQPNGQAQAVPPINRYSPYFLGWMFFGDAFYFLFAVFIRRWRAACAQLCSFLAYDLVLLGPFLIRWPVLRDLAPFADLPRLHPDLINNLLVYSLVLIYSGAIGVYYLFIDRRTRLVARGD